MRSSGGIVPKKRVLAKPAKRRKGRFGFTAYISREIWRERSRSLMVLVVISMLSFIFSLFMAMDSGLSSYFRDDIGEPDERDKSLFEVKEVIRSWSTFMTFLCGALMVLSIANTSAINVVERRFELASLRAMGWSGLQVSMVVAAPLLLILFLGLALGMAALWAVVIAFGGEGIVLGPGGLSVPVVFDERGLYSTVGLGAISTLIGLLPPLWMVNRSAPMEVLRDAA